MSKGIGGHQSANMKNDEWYTPPEIIKPLGEFDLDPCSHLLRPWDTAKNHFTKEDNGLNKEWFGRVWLNPPYGREAAAWMEKLKNYGNGVALIFARTETAMFFNHIWNDAAAILFIEGRLSFYYRDGFKAKANSGAPSVLIAYGNENVLSLYNSKIKGKIIELNK